MEKTTTYITFSTKPDDSKVEGSTTKSIPAESPNTDITQPKFHKLFMLRLPKNECPAFWDTAEEAEPGLFHTVDVSEFNIRVPEIQYKPTTKKSALDGITNELHKLRANSLRAFLGFITTKEKEQGCGLSIGYLMVHMRENGSTADTIFVELVKRE
ncbi:hypothetical protein BJ508DRAFT_324746 [Ascobolus immersus RN42]|uniref:Uncharacterized protein n=1 Tax=Ascobolus immersus RN42 TaxID=1160509 RepID=A0A3N4IAQ0_ASCIM|nr:hypothetical protein BJ508DRAFT_324746 [Ascobolus immersus RN42]